MRVAPTQPVAPTAYLAAERLATQKHILWDGAIFARAGASRVHNRLVAAILGELRGRLLAGPCAPYASDQRIRLASSKRYVYPDVSVVCDPVETDELDAETIVNPRVLIEVLSESTEAFDRGDKFLAYRELPSLQDYLLVAQALRRIEHYVRQADGGWTLRTYREGAFVPLASLGIELGVDAIYTGIDLSA